MVARRNHPQLRAGFDYAIRRGELVAVLPGIYTAGSLRTRPGHPDAGGDAAAP